MEVIRRNTDYALRLMVHLARSAGGDAISARRLAEEEGVSPQLASKLLQQLGGAGLVQSRMGARGGFSLKKPAAEINLAQMITVIQGPISLNRCAALENVCPQQNVCRICGKLRSLQGHLDQTLTSITLAELAGESATEDGSIPPGLAPGGQIISGPLG